MHRKEHLDAVAGSQVYQALGRKLRTLCLDEAKTVSSELEARLSEFFAASRTKVCAVTPPPRFRCSGAMPLGSGVSRGNGDWRTEPVLVPKVTLFVWGLHVMRRRMWD